MTRGQDARYDDALAALAQDSPAQACALLSELVDEQPEFPEAWAALGQAHLKLGNMTGAVAALTEAHLQAPEDIKVTLDLAFCQWRTGHADIALKALSKLPAGAMPIELVAQIITDLPPQFPESASEGMLALMKEAAHYWAGQAEWAKAAIVFRHIAQSSSSDAEAFCDLMAAETSASGLLSLDIPILGLSQLLQLRRTIDAFRKAHAITPSLTRLWRNLGMVLIRLDERTNKKIQANEANVQCMIRWLELEPMDPGARAAVADIFYSRRQLDGAVAILSGRMIPSCPAEQEQAIDAFLDRIDGALADIETLLAKPPSIEGTVEISNILEGLGFSREAATILKHAYQAAPDRSDIRNNLADLLVQHRLLVDSAAIYTGRAPLPLPPMVGACS